MPRITLTNEQKVKAEMNKQLEHVRAVMALSHITQEQVASYCGLTQQAVSKQLSGTGKLSLEVFVAVGMLQRERDEKKNT